MRNLTSLTLAKMVLMAVGAIAHSSCALASTDDRPELIKSLRLKLSEKDGVAFGACYTDLSVTASQKARYDYYLLLQRGQQKGYIIELVHIDGVGLANLGDISFSGKNSEVDGIQGGIGTEQRLQAYSNDIRKDLMPVTYSLDDVFKIPPTRKCSGIE